MPTSPSASNDKRGDALQSKSVQDFFFTIGQQVQQQNAEFASLKESSSFTAPALTGLARQ
ncbi:uncharacterized protein LAESUDRAFT_730835 [Laetiporus sulphureus 93-53]|uniref:Uncharacterized protein n=1 Tax=Laetiporus sulphureus 93-53 TaxID=1314785 RepID=A0A165BZB8_9APHY|nr:uncharacterized protein LAESUDRAFT_730835 [Laetiporus sulphureus 93-53]KZT01924.1 hypothetical protein LAESUDRAFT_730835 [Laetiporus sulphureus 93-53]